MDTRIAILDIAMNLTRMGDWAASDYGAKKERIKTFLDNTTQYIHKLDTASFPPPFKNTFERFRKEYARLERQVSEGPTDPLEWAEAMMTWGNILTHRSKLLL